MPDFHLPLSNGITGSPVVWCLVLSRSWPGRISASYTNVFLALSDLSDQNLQFVEIQVYIDDEIYLGEPTSPKILRFRNILEIRIMVPFGDGGKCLEGRIRGL